jgi:signal transduction histidine kinase
MPLFATEIADEGAEHFRSAPSCWPPENALDPAAMTAARWAIAMSSRAAPIQEHCRSSLVLRAASHWRQAKAEDFGEMVRNLLAITGIDAGALELRRDWIDLPEMAERVAARHQGAWQHVELGLPTDLPLVRADATRAGHR